MGFDMDIEGLKKKFKDAIEKVPKKVGDAIEEEGQKIFDRTQVIVPRERTRTYPEELKDSGVLDHSHSGTKYSSKITYGDSDTDGVGVDYAAAVHEILTARHDPPTQAKYVEQPLIEAIPDVKKAVAAAIEKKFKEVLR